MSPLLPPPLLAATSDCCSSAPGAGAGGGGALTERVLSSVRAECGSAELPPAATTVVTSSICERHGLREGR